MRVRRVVTSRPGGVSRPPYDAFNLGAHVGDDPAAVGANRRRLAGELGVGADRLAWMDQVHGSAVAVLDRPAARPLPATDALVTAVRGLPLAVVVADCVPVLMADPVAGVVAAVHAGRPGAAAGIAVRALRAMLALGAEPDRVDVLLGPAVCGGCYEVPARMRAEVDAALPGSASRTRRGTAGLDLRAGIAAQLRAEGVGQVVQDSRCTAEDTALFSYRRDGRTGRQAGLVWLAD
ncbi:MAG TPA: peptidoglycan editing factor PgeF [Mycobacteriales bacterium]|nr:peptidoglycan editing factor PgeF [Mycobacteriales bacterium]